MIIDFPELLNLKNKKNRLLGIDLGEKTIGLALSDHNWFIATPYELIKRKNKQTDILALQKIIKDFDIAGFVIGYPLNMNGSQGPSCERVEKFSALFETVPILFWDERLSTVAVTRTLLQADVSRKKRADHVDKMAASFILQGVLDRLSYLTNTA